jgi:hypothetical protein
MPAQDHQKSFILTVAEAKRLIARAVKLHPAVDAALKNGIVAVAKGSTNSYVVEELTGERIRRQHYCTGVTRPLRGGQAGETADRLPDLVLRKGERVQGTPAVKMAAEMGPGDVFIKGANALNYDKRQAGILIGHPTGGTVGAVLGTLVSRRVTLLIPVGLEKSIPGDIHELYREMAAAGPTGSGPMLWPVDGEILTEVEAIGLLSGARAAPIGAGGIGGAEGSVRLSVWGSAEQVNRAEAAIEAVLGEPPFLAAQP